MDAIDNSAEERMCGVEGLPRIPAGFVFRQAQPARQILVTRNSNLNFSLRSQLILSTRHIKSVHNLYVGELLSFWEQDH